MKEIEAHKDFTFLLAIFQPIILSSSLIHSINVNQNLWLIYISTHYHIWFFPSALHSNDNAINAIIIKKNFFKSPPLFRQSGAVKLHHTQNHNSLLISKIFILIVLFQHKSLVNITSCYRFHFVPTIFCFLFHYNTLHYK